MAEMTVEVVSAERRLFHGEATAVYARSLDGEIGILPGHQPCLLSLDIAPLRIETTGGETEAFAVHGGFLYFRENHLVVLADTAEPAGEIDASRAQRGVDAAGDDAVAARRAAVRLRVANAATAPR